MKKNNLSHLWKTKNKAWMKKREEDWSCLNELLNNDYEEHDFAKNVNKNYFLFGIRDGYIPSTTEFFMTPIVTMDDAKLTVEQICDVGKEDYQLVIKRLYHNSFQLFDKALLVDWGKDQIVFYLKSVLSDQTEKIFLKDYSEAVYDPTSWCKYFIQSAESLLLGRTNNYYLYLFVEHFSNALKFTNSGDNLKKEQLNMLSNYIDYIGKSANYQLNEFARKENITVKELARDKIYDNLWIPKEILEFTKALYTHIEVIKVNWPEE